MIRRKKLTIFTDAKESTTVLELKKMIEGSVYIFPLSFLVLYLFTYFDFYFAGILKIPPNNQQLFNKDNQVMQDNKCLSDCGLLSAIAKAQCPALVGLAIRQENNQFEPLEMTPFSTPPDLPDVMKTQEPSLLQESQQIAMNKVSSKSTDESNFVFK